MYIYVYIFTLIYIDINVKIYFCRVQRPAPGVPQRLRARALPPPRRRPGQGPAGDSNSRGPLPQVGGGRFRPPFGGGGGGPPSVPAPPRASHARSGASAPSGRAQFYQRGEIPSTLRTAILTAYAPPRPPTPAKEITGRIFTRRFYTQKNYERE